MKKIIVIGSPGSGKSTFSRKLAEKTNLPLYYLDMIHHRADRTTVTRDEFDARLGEIMAKDRWIIDGNYKRTVEARLAECDTVFLFDIPVNDCIAGVEARIGRSRPDMPWIEEEFDGEFKAYIENFPTDALPVIDALLGRYSDKVDIIRFKSRGEADEYLNMI